MCGCLDLVPDIFLDTCVTNEESFSPQCKKVNAANRLIQITILPSSMIN